MRSRRMFLCLALFALPAMVTGQNDSVENTNISDHIKEFKVVYLAPIKKVPGLVSLRKDLHPPPLHNGTNIVYGTNIAYGKNRIRIYQYEDSILVFDAQFGAGSPVWQGCRSVLWDSSEVAITQDFFANGRLEKLMIQEKTKVELYQFSKEGQLIHREGIDRSELFEEIKIDSMAAPEVEMMKNGGIIERTIVVTPHTRKNGTVAIVGKTSLHMYRFEDSTVVFESEYWKGRIIWQESRSKRGGMASVAISAVYYESGPLHKLMVGDEKKIVSYVFSTEGELMKREVIDRTQ